MTPIRTILVAVVTVVLLASVAMSTTATEEVRFCVTVRSEEPIEGDVLAAVTAGEASIIIEGPAACAEAAPTSGPDIAAALDLLASLLVEPERPAGYDRDLFRHWIDADGDGCDTRREVLIDESLTEVTVGQGCSLSGGSWVSVFDAIETTDASELDVDHVVPLAEAWRSGAQEWSERRREHFANDLDDARTLRAVSASSNRSKGDRDPADWLPPDESFHCTYAADWVSIKTTWGLAVDPAERVALSTILADC